MVVLPVNTLEINENISLPYDEIERGLNSLSTVDVPHKTRKLIHSFMVLLKKTRETLFHHHNLKQGLIYKNLAELYLIQGKVEYGRYFFEIAAELLMDYKGIYSEIQEKLKDL